MIDFDHVLDAINDVTQKSEKYVIGNHFTEQSSLSLADWATFLSFKEDKTLQSDIENYISNYWIITISSIMPFIFSFEPSVQTENLGIIPFSM